MKLPIFILSISLIIGACKKDSAPATTSNENGPKQPDQIMYTDIDPDYILNSLDSVYAIPGGPGCPIAVPVDSIVEFEIDLNNDNVMDYKFRMKHWYYFVSASNPCANYNYSMSITGLGGNKVATLGEYNKALLLEFDQEINQSLAWNSNAFIMMKAASVPFSYDPSGVHYIGLKLKNDLAYNFAWLLVDKKTYELHIKEMAINETTFNSIKAGQLE